jgi:hypothetical protein
LLHILNGVAGLHVQSNGLARQGLHENLHGCLCINAMEGEEETNIGSERARLSIMRQVRSSVQDVAMYTYFPPFRPQARRRWSRAKGDSRPPYGQNHREGKIQQTDN